MPVKNDGNRTCSVTAFKRCIFESFGIALLLTVVTL